MTTAANRHLCGEARRDRYSSDVVARVAP